MKKKKSPACIYFTAFCYLFNWSWTCVDKLAIYSNSKMTRKSYKTYWTQLHLFKGHMSNLIVYQHFAKLWLLYQKRVGNWFY